MSLFLKKQSVNYLKGSKIVRIGFAFAFYRKGVSFEGDTNRADILKLNKQLNMESFTIKQGNETELDLVKPLWEKLNQLHVDLSPYFKGRYREMDWNKRKLNLLNKSKKTQLDYVIIPENDEVIGYCISSIDKEDDTIGEIDSIYIDETYRKSGLGKQLIERAILWLINNGTETQKIIVGVGNEHVLDFYKQLDFYPLHIVLQRNTKN